ncbi:MAG: SDR family oxidoreductase [Verrucomicrobiae bacterium]|nr:SDR family oxidoreductase [Verrucomicrobiae bacterium]
MNIDESVTAITGAGRGIGLALARKLSSEGGRVVLLDQDADRLTGATRDLPSEQVLGVVVDVRDRIQLDEAVERTVRHFGKLDAWINNAGLARHMPVADYREEDLDLMMDVNLKGAVLGCQAALAVMVPQGHGRIVNVVSTAALRGIPTESFYCATKWALRGFTQALAEEVAPQGIAVSAILPGGVDTAFWDDAVDRQMPVSDFLTPDQVADAILSILRQDDRSVVRELVVRSLADRDFAGG